ncbi:MAG TPA: GNAT family N-acetyltransferase [Bryobacteraceae bacterium]|nr:GNAT family N-acetyltransferase [Bryobacteraceae bacterium]
MKRACPASQYRSTMGDRTDSIREATPNDIPGIVTIHQKAFSNFFLTKLGSEFLRKYYSLVLNYRSGIILVSEGQTVVSDSAGLVSEPQTVLHGFACGFVDPAEFYQLMWRTKLNFALPVLSALVLHPSLITKVLHGVQRIYTPSSEWPVRSCELSSIAVTPETAGFGVGKILIRGFLTQARSMGARCVYLTTDADGNDAVNAFYLDVGFQHTRRFLQHEGRWMNEYVINGLEATDGCETQP